MSVHKCDRRAFHPGPGLSACGEAPRSGLASGRVPWVCTEPVAEKTGAGGTQRGSPYGFYEALGELVRTGECTPYMVAGRGGISEA